VEEDEGVELIPTKNAFDFIPERNRNENVIGQFDGPSYYDQRGE
jgi:hypothetical protein